ncbi:UDP-N-acetylmuramoyl-L-alanine--D-glutamate ligase [Halomonas halocynthiae]|uniref:UDP-N-acetylmuramoyl-L-alanine--D-glutamate ligase n=1 Tax=Halomonas halocynthiae TaxID=176290 RepID=UPI0003FEDFF1|nr:UDP-N-acetylmuramoyl-L-alanine--D-glutamate ligase [Halomonas halocynthiae]
MDKVPAGVTLVVGLGISGRAICRHLDRLGCPFMVADTRANPPDLASFRQEFPDVTLRCGALDSLNMSEARDVVVSPGVSLQQPALAALQNTPAGPPVIGEIALFLRACQAPIAAITGSNAKSTVTTLLGEMAAEAGKNVAVGGNLGTPALDLLHDMPDAELFILELSSFQLESLSELGAEAAVFLNLSEDHLDRHGDMAGYRRAKQRVFMGARYALVNGEDAMTWPDDGDVTVVERFTSQPPGPGEWGVANLAAEDDGGDSDAAWLMYGGRPLMPVSAVRAPGRHNHVNALAALAVGNHFGFPLQAMRTVLERFSGLPHRCELVAEQQGVRWINDSKGTNVGATLAAIAGIGPTLTGRLVLLAGGVGKGADFSPLVEPLAAYAREVIVFGRDAVQLQRVLEPHVMVTKVVDLEAALRRALNAAQAGDCVLLSPACASLDQFSNYQARGDAFRDGVTQLYKEVAL